MGGAFTTHVGLLRFLAGFKPEQHVHRAPANQSCGQGDDPDPAPGGRGTHKDDADQGNADDDTQYAIDHTFIHGFTP